MDDDGEATVRPRTWAGCLPSVGSTPTQHEITEQAKQAQLMLLRGVTHAPERGSASTALTYAEAYAWLLAPAHPRW